MSPKLLLSIALCLLCLIAPMTYMPKGSWSELIILGLLTIIFFCASWSLYHSRTLAQGSRARRGQLPFDSLFTPALWGAWLGVIGTGLTVLPISMPLLSMIAPQTAHDWLEFKQSLDAIRQVSEGAELNYFSLSLSPGHSQHWFTIQLAWISVIYLAGLVRGLRRPLLFALASIGPLLASIALIHILGDSSLLYFYFQSADRAQLTGFITAVINPNHAASLLMLSAFVALGLAEEINQSVDKQPKDQKLSTLFYLCAIISSTALFFTSSRAAMAIHYSMLGLWLLRSYVSWINFRRLLLLCGLSFSILGPLCIVLLIQYQWWQDQAVVKGQSWLDSLNLIFQYFPWGVGREGFGEVFTHYQSLKTMNWISHPENQVIRGLAEAGLIGLLSILCYSWSWWKWWRLKSIQSHPIAFNLGLGVTGLALHQGYDFGIESLGVMIPCACAWGLMWGYQPPRDSSKAKKLSLKKRSSAWSKSVKQVTLLSILLIVSLLVLSFKQSPIRRVIKVYDERPNLSFLISEGLKHPLSAHIAVRLANSAQLSLDERLLWVKRSKSLAPIWSSPLIAEARLLHQLGFDQVAALNYRRVLAESPELRDFVFKDLLRSPLSYPYNEWLPKKDWYSFYKQYFVVDPQAAHQFLRSLDSESVSKDLNLRALYIRYLVPSCHKQDQKALLSLIPYYEQLLRKHGASQASLKSKTHCLLKQDLITYKKALVMCAVSEEKVIALNQSWAELYEPLKNQLCYEQYKKDLDSRAEKSFFSLRKILKNR